MYRIESLLSARLFLAPQIVGERIYFISNLSGHLSLYAMDHGGSVPEPLLPPDIALQNPHLLQGYSFYTFNDLGKIMIIIDEDGNEDYKPMYIPLQGGHPTSAFGDSFEDDKIFLTDCFPKERLAYLVANSKKEAIIRTYRADLKTEKLDKLFESPFGGVPAGWNEDHTKIIIMETYTFGDNTLYLWDEDNKETQLLYGTPISDRRREEKVPLNGIHSCHFVPSGRGIFMHTTLFEDRGGLGYLSFEQPDEIIPASIQGEIHRGFGTFNGLSHLKGSRYLAKYNIDGCDWLYEGVFDEASLKFIIDHNITGQGLFSDGVVEHLNYDQDDDIFVLSFSSATSPNQIFTVEGNDRNKITQHTHERVLGIDEDLLSPGEDASYKSFDGTQISARIYLPAKGVGVESPYPLVYYVHGGPQSQERPDFTWFSMPLIQFLTLHGFAVFVPNVRGSIGYGLKFMKEVDRDWGGKDRLDHVHAMTEVLPKDSRIDTSRAGVVGRSYGGYMTLMLAGRHPELWKAAVDMFGPYDLVTFSERIPETWKPYFIQSLADPEDNAGRKFLIERSPRTYIDQIECPLMVIQGKNDPRVVEHESRDLVEHLRRIGKEIDYLLFEDEGHDILKYKNRVKVYNQITQYFNRYLKD